MIYRMAYPRKLLSDDERVELELHPHWKALALPVLVLLLTVPVASFAAAKVPAGDARLPLRVVVLAIAVGVLFFLTFMPFLRWTTTHYVVTDRRLITRSGIIARSGRDMPLIRINDISFAHTVPERILGCGTLVVESAGERGQLTLIDVPRVEFVQRRIYELADDAANPDEPARDGGRG
jgi:uncharacterized membrane protein YdbT with pleckstrin-like domain